MALTFDPALGGHDARADHPVHARERLRSHQQLHRHRRPAAPAGPLEADRVDGAHHPVHDPRPPRRHVAEPAVAQRPDLLHRVPLVKSTGVAPSSPALSRRSGTRSTTSTSPAPRSSALSAASSPTAPAPKIATLLAGSPRPARWRASR